MTKHLIPILACILVSSCAQQALMGVQTCEVEYEPLLISNEQSLESLLFEIENILNDEGYDVVTNEVTYTIVTLPTYAGVYRWRENNEKWKLSYQLGFQLIKGSDDRVFWTLSHKIVGIRSGREPRTFGASDFDETEKIFTKLKLVISNQLRIIN